MTEPQATPATQPAQAPGRCPVLWVEDDPVLSGWVAEALQDDGWHVLVAHDRQQALQVLEREVPKGQACVALLDMGLPPRPSRPDEGLLLLSQLVTHWPVLHAIVLTGQSEKAVGQQAVHAGAFDFLTKPVAAVALRHALERAAWFALRQQELLAQGRLHLSVSAQLSEGVREASDRWPSSSSAMCWAAMGSMWLRRRAPWGWSGSSSTTT